MATKHFCDLCQAEIVGNDFRSELIVVYVKHDLVFVDHKKDSQSRIVEKRYQFCQKCLSDKLPGFDN
jgi:hypothetical protein